MLLFVGLLFVLEKKCSFCSVSISRGVILQSSHSDSHSAFVLSVLTFFGVLDKGVTGLFLLEFFTKVLMVYA